MRHWLITVVVVLVVVIAAAWGYEYVVDQQTYVSTDNATVEADTYTVSATQSGVLSVWSLHDGDQVTNGNTVGDIAGKTKLAITTPITGSVIKTSVYPKQIVIQGQPLAKIANLNQAYVLALIDEDKVSQVKLGKKVKVSIESLLNGTYDGTVSQIGSATGDVYNGTSSTQETEKVTKRVPVKILISDLPVDRVILGAHAEVKIEK